MSLIHRVICKLSSLCAQIKSEEELKSVEVDGGKAAAAPAPMGVSTSTPSLGPRSYTMESSKSGTSAATSDDFDYLVGSDDKGQLLPSTQF